MNDFQKAIPPFLEMVNIHKAFPGVIALDNVSFTLERGQVHALLGENGAGKSTLIKILAGVHKMDAGHILIDGQEQIFRSPKQALEAGIAVIYQELCLALDMTVAENIFMGREMRTKFGFVDTRKMEREAAQLLESLGVDIPPNAVLRSLSLAQKQTVEIAKCVSTNARIIVMDEPTSSLTDSEVEMLFKLIKRLQTKDVGIIYISHRMDEIFSICDTVTVLRDGKTVGTRPLEGTTREELISMMVGRKLTQYYTKDCHVKDEVVLRVENFVTAFSPHKISFELRKGEILGFSGLIGAGRSELMRAIFGYDKKVDGTLYLLGKEVIIRRPFDAINNKIAMISEDRRKEGLILSNDLMFNLSLLCLNKFISKLRVYKNREEAIADEQIETLSIQTAGYHQTVATLSGGNQQKVVLGKWLAREPELIIMDEPTRGIDVGAKSEIYAIMNRLTAQGCSIIMVSSDLPEIIGMCDRVVVMMEGKITAVLSRNELTQEKIMFYSLHRESHSADASTTQEIRGKENILR